MAVTNACLKSTKSNLPPDWIHSNIRQVTPLFNLYETVLHPPKILPVNKLRKNKITKTTNKQILFLSNYLLLNQNVWSLTLIGNYDFAMEKTVLLILNNYPKITVQ